jgi:tetratricopeptide (TPR) repeat protein
MAGYDDGVGARGDSAVRQAVRKHLEGFQGESRGLLENAYQELKQSDSDANLSQWVSFALTCEPPPTFALLAELPTDLPPEVRRLRGFSRLLEQFYQEADIEGMWQQVQPAVEAEMIRYQDALAPMLFRTAGYLRLSAQSREFQGFKVWIDLMSAPGAVNTRLYGGEVQIVVHPNAEVPLDEIQHAFLVHLLDRLSIRYREEVSRIEVLSRFAMFAPALDEAYKTDFELLTTQCLAKAVQQQLRRAPEADKLAAVDEALREGYVLTPYFYEKLDEFEKDGRDINRYYPDLIKGVDLKREAARLQATTFVEAPSKPVRRAPAPPKVSEVDKMLERGEFLMTQDMLDEARESFMGALEKAGGSHAQASYGLARVAILEADPDLAREHFARAAELAEDPHLKAMAYVYLGRIADIIGNREEAIKNYRLALDAGDPSERTRELAEQGINAPFARPGEEPEEESEEEPDL